MTRIDAYLHFNGNCSEAMTFYKECLGGELNMQMVGDSPMADQMPADARQSILHAALVKDDLTLLASDMVMGSLVAGNVVELCIDCSSEEEINTFFSKLSVGGQITHPLKAEFWGGIFGGLTDKFGVLWTFNYQKNPQA